MSSEKLNQSIKSWQESRLGLSPEPTVNGSVPVLARPSTTTGGDGGLTAARMGGRSVIVAREEWVEPLEMVTAGMHPDLLFTVFGAYELSRVTLPDGFAVWGPNWYMFSDRDSWHGRADGRVTRLESTTLGEIDFELFWHCFGPDSLAAFAVYEDGELSALATVKGRGEPFMEIGVDVVKSAQASGLGMAVVSAAGDWILEQGRLPMATVAPFNVPSTRTLRRVGLEYGMTEMSTAAGPFRVPPQPMGRPAPGVEIFNYYPDWAMNQEIRPRPES